MPRAESAGPAAAASPSATPRLGGTFDYPLQNDVNSLLPYLAMDSSDVAHQVYEGLFAYETREHGTVVTSPCLAET
jgi:hypothetical protein